MRILSYSVLFAALMAGCKKDSDSDDTDPVDTNDPNDTDDTDPVDTDDPDAACWVEGPVGECYDCDLPAEPDEDSLRALNQCSEVSYSVFDNATRIPSSTWVPGTPLPTVP